MSLGKVKSPMIWDRALVEAFSRCLLEREKASVEEVDEEVSELVAQEIEELLNEKFGYELRTLSIDRLNAIRGEMWRISEPLMTTLLTHSVLHSSSEVAEWPEWMINEGTRRFLEPVKIGSGREPELEDKADESDISAEEVLVAATQLLRGLNADMRLHSADIDRRLAILDSQSDE